MHRELLVDSVTNDCHRIEVSKVQGLIHFFFIIFKFFTVLEIAVLEPRNKVHLKLLGQDKKSNKTLHSKVGWAKVKVYEKYPCIYFCILSFGLISHPTFLWPCPFAYFGKGESGASKTEWKFSFCSSAIKPNLYSLCKTRDSVMLTSTSTRC